MNLLDRTTDLLQTAIKRGHSLRNVATTSEGRVEYDWLKRVAKGGIADPSVNRIQNLHDHLRSLLSKRRS